MNAPLAQDSLLRQFPTIDGCKLLPPCLLYSKIGEGGYGAVYLAKHLRLENDVAVKCLLLRPGRAGRAAVTRFEREARLAAAIDHPNLITVIDMREELGLHYLVMEYVPGETLRDRITRLGPASAGEAVAIASAVAGALSAAHQRGVIHRDVKPDNVMLSQDGRVKLADLGLAKAAEFQHGSSMTVERTWLGTPGYMSPEQWDDAGSAGIAADVYALGATLYFMLTGRDPLRAGNYADMLRQAQSLSHLDPSTVRSGLPSELLALVADATARDPKHRVRDMDEFLARLQPLAQPVDLADQGAGELNMAASSAASSPSYRTLVVARKRLSGSAEARVPEAEIEEVEAFAVHSPRAEYIAEPAPRASAAEMVMHAPVARRARTRSRRRDWTPSALWLVMLPIVFFGWRAWKADELRRAHAADEASASAAARAIEQREREQRKLEDQARQLDARGQEFQLALDACNIADAERALRALEAAGATELEPLRARFAEREKIYVSMRAAANSLTQLDTGLPLPADQLTQARELCETSPECCRRSGLSEALDHAERSSEDRERDLLGLFDRWKDVTGATMSDLARGLAELQAAEPTARHRGYLDQLELLIDAVSTTLAARVTELEAARNPVATLDALIDLDRVASDLNGRQLPGEVGAAGRKLSFVVCGGVAAADEDALAELVESFRAWELATSELFFEEEHETIREAVLTAIFELVEGDEVGSPARSLTALSKMLAAADSAGEDEGTTRRKVHDIAYLHLASIQERAAGVETLDALLELNQAVWAAQISHSMLDEGILELEGELLLRADSLPQGLEIKWISKGCGRIAKWGKSFAGTPHADHVAQLGDAWNSILEQRVLEQVDAIDALIAGGKFTAAVDAIRLLKEDLDDDQPIRLRVLLAGGECKYAQALTATDKDGALKINRLDAAHKAYRLVLDEDIDYHLPDGDCVRFLAAERAIDVLERELEVTENEIARAAEKNGTAPGAEGRKTRIENDLKTAHGEFREASEPHEDSRGR